MQGGAAAVAKINERVKHLQQFAGQSSRQRMLSVGVRLHQRRDRGWYYGALPARGQAPIDDLRKHLVGERVGRVSGTGTFA